MRLRRRVIGAASAVLAVLLLLRLAGVVGLPVKWLAVGWGVDILLGLAELGVAVAGARAFVQGTREGGVLTGYERWIDKEQELGLPRPLAAAARVELRLYRAVARLLHR
jgi:hypothetical protein